MGVVGSRHTVRSLDVEWSDSPGRFLLLLSQVTAVLHGAWWKCPVLTSGEVERAILLGWECQTWWKVELSHDRKEGSEVKPYTPSCERLSFSPAALWLLSRQGVDAFWRKSGPRILMFEDLPLRKMTHCLITSANLRSPQALPLLHRPFMWATCCEIHVEELRKCVRKVYSNVWMLV